MLYNRNKVNEIVAKKIDELNIYQTRTYLDIIISYIKKLYDKNKELNAEDLQSTLWQEYLEKEGEYSAIALDLGGIHIQQIVGEYLKNNPEEAQRIYEMNKGKKYVESNDYYTYNIKREKNRLVKEMLHFYREYCKEQNNDDMLKKEEEMFPKMVELYSNFFVDQRKTRNILLLQDFYENFLKRYNLTGKYISNYGNQLRLLGLYELSDDKHIATMLENTFDKKSLEKKTAEELAIMNIFWQNKKSKEQTQIYQAMIMARDLGIFDKVVNGEEIDIANAQIKNSMKKIFELYILCDEQYRMNDINIEKGASKEISEEMLDYINLNKESYKTEYDKSITTSYNDMEQDFIIAYSGYVQNRNIYTVKDNLIVSIVLNLLDNKIVKNWGIIEDVKVGPEDTNNIIIGIDLPGMNMPVRVHVDKNIILRVLHGMKRDTLLPIYQGEKDFSNKITIVKSHMLLDVDKDYKKKLWEYDNEFKDEGIVGHVVSHLKYIANPKKVPEHLKVQQHGTRARAQMKKWKNLITDEVFVEKQKELIPEEEYYKRNTYDDENNGGDSR